MANRPALVSQAEIKRAVAGILAAGLRVGRVEVDHRNGRVIVIPEGSQPILPGPDPDELLR